LNQFKYEKLSSPVEASSKILEHGEDEARILAGGTALIIMMKEKVLTPSLLLDISQIQSLKGVIFTQEKGLWIGSMTTHYEIESSSDVERFYPSLKEAFHSIGNLRVRMAGTIGGNLAYSEPQCNPPAILAALDAIVHVKNSMGNERAVPAEGFIRGIFESALESGEVITHITIPPPGQGSFCSFFKFTTKSRTDKPTSTVAVYLEPNQKLTKIERSRIVVGAVGPKTYRCKKAEAFVENSNLNSLNCSKAAEIASEEFETMDDLYGPSWYKKRVTQSIIRDELKKAVAHISGQLGEYQT
jgi:carbon-monoxide dehydrogenase medium subunit